MSYRGRFAPTPSGPLHAGSLLTALASYLDAKSHGGVWLLRMDDLDAPRCVLGAADQILRQLDAYGLHWDETVRYQSHHVHDYEAALATLQTRALVYRCVCTRAELKRDSLPGPDDAVYAGRCRGTNPDSSTHSLRLQMDTGTLELHDPCQGRLTRDRVRDIGDFVVRRNDGAIAYQLACVVDEATQHITDVWRGADLIGSSFRQRHLQSLLVLPSPRYRHLPVLLDTDGRKLSKQNHAPPLTSADVSAQLIRSLHRLGQAPSEDLIGASPATLLASAIKHWNPSAIPSGISLSFHGAAQQHLA